MKMKDDTLASKTQKFLKMVNEDHIYLCPALDFRTVCKLLEVEPDELDASLQESIGHSGKELMFLMKKDYISYIKKKYGLNVGNAQ